MEEVRRDPMDNRTELGGDSSPQNHLVYSAIVETQAPNRSEMSKVNKPYNPFEKRNDYRHFGINE